MGHMLRMKAESFGTMMYIFKSIHVRSCAKGTGISKTATIGCSAAEDP